MSSLRTDLSSFEWRMATGRWRWLILGSLGLTAGGCWGRSDEPQPAPERGPGGTTLTGAAGSGAGGSVALASQFHACNDPEPLDGGWERCANGLVHRPVVGQCPSQLPRAQAIDPAIIQRIYPNYAPGSGTGGSMGVDRPACERDGDCKAGPYGYCEPGYLGEGSPAVICRYGCVSDSDCSAGSVCVCNGGPIGSCVQSSCSSDADCEGDAMCAGYTSEPGCNLPAVGCQTSRDTCAIRADCGERQECTMDSNSLSPAWHCADWTCSIGRPFLIDGSARLAPCEARADWFSSARAAALNADCAGLGPELRAAAAQGWLQQALMEHASVAAFARFSLQLLSLGAPADLLSAAAQAQADEIAHAQDCFALARRHGAGDVGPGPLPLAGALDEMDLRSIVLGTVVEGCIGETVAALEAAEACSHCTDPAARSALQRIAADETRHAQLAWRFVAWALEIGPASLRGELSEAFARELAALPSAAPASSELDRRLLQQGLMTDGLRAGLRGRVLREVIAPCADALLARAGRPQAVSGCASTGVTAGILSVIRA
jgi:hypothetical protein